MKVIWSAASVRHLQQVFEYLGEGFGPAVTIRQRILETARRVGQMPLSGRIGRMDGTREAVVPRTSFILVYQITEQAVEVVGIWHAAREWPKSF